MSVPPEQMPPYSGYTSRPTVRFDAISDGLRYLQAEMGSWIVAALIYLIILMAVVFGFMGAAFAEVFSAMQSGKPPKNYQPSIGMDLITSFVIAVVAGFLTAGLYRMATRQIRGERINPGMLFSAGDVLPSILVLSIVINVGSALMKRLPFGGILTFIVSIIAGGILMFAYPLIVDRRVSLGEALGESWGAFTSQAFMAIFFNIVVVIIQVIGLACCCVGGLFTIPLHVLAISCVYRDFFMEPPAPGPYTPPPTAPPPPPPAPESPTPSPVEAPSAPSTSGVTAATPPPPPPPFGPDAESTAPEVENASAPHTPPPTVTEPPPISAEETPSPPTSQAEHKDNE